MNALDLQTINQRAPYKLRFIADSKYGFTSSDGQEALRARLFTRKFNIYRGHEKYIFKSIETHTEGIPYYAALIFRKDHPQAPEISQKFDFVVEELKDK